MPECPLSTLPGASAAAFPNIPAGADILHVGLSPSREKSHALLVAWLDWAGLTARSAFIDIEMHRTRDLQCKYCRMSYWDGPKWDAILSRGLQYANRFLEGGNPKAKDITKTMQRKIDQYPLIWECHVQGLHTWKEVHVNREPRESKTGECCGLPVIQALLRNPRWSLVLCWGAVPAREVAGYSGAVGHMVGRFRTLPSGQTCTVLYHPSYALRQKGSPEFAQTEGITREVLRQVRDRVEHPDATGDYPYVSLGASGAHVLHDRSVVDVETTVRVPEHPDPRLDAPHTLCVGGLDSDEVTLARTSIYDDLIVPRGAKLVMHNGQYDLPLLFRQSEHMDFGTDDTMVMAYLTGESSLSLKILGRRLLQRHTREFKETVGDDLEYAAQDPHLTRDLYHILRRRIDTKGLAFLYDEVKTPVQRIMARHTVLGLKVNHARVQALDDKMTERAAILRAHLVVLAGREFNPQAPEQCAEIIFDELGFPLESTREGPKRTTGELYIDQFRAHPFIGALLAYRRAIGFLKVTRKLLPLDRISGLYDITGTGTDRVSQSNRNCMNFNILVKNCIEADEGGYWVYGDFSQIELRYAAYFSHDEYLLSVLREGRNMHEELCIAVYGARTPDAYTQAKASNFSKLFGAGLKKRAQTLKMPVSVVRRNEVPWPQWDVWVGQRRQEPAKTFWGYERDISDNVESEDERLRDKANRQIINSIIQGSAGETTQYAQVLSDRALAKLGGYVIHQEHDSVLGWMPNSVPVDIAKAALSEAMIAAVPQDIKDVIEMKVKVITGKFWG